MSVPVQFAHPIPWWAWVLIAAAIAGLAYGAYARPLVPITPSRRARLIALRTATLALLVVCVLRPMALQPPRLASNAVVPILVDISRSMRLPDAGGARRIERAAEVLHQLQAALAAQFQTDVLTFGETLAPGPAGPLSANARRSDLTGALTGVGQRYRGRPLAGVIVISDGGDTAGHDAAATVDAAGPAVYPIGIGSPRVRRDREILGVTAGDAALADSVVDLSVSAVSHGYGTDPIELRVSANGRPTEVRRVQPAADGSPVYEVFPVSPDRSAATLYTVAIAAAPDDLAPENNTRSVIVGPPGRKRRLLLVEGAPGFEHSFLKRAWSQDSGLAVDSVVRKGRNEQGANTFFVQADAAHTAPLVTGYPLTREALFAYDAVVLGNVEADFLTSDQLAFTAEFVAKRGGGLLVLGARSFAQHGLIGTPLEEALPVELSDRRDSVLRTSSVREAQAEPHKVTITADGDAHPVMRLTLSPDENRKRWASLPPLAASASLGGPRPGAQILAVTGGTAGSVRPMVAVQRYGKGRSMVFAGEASWRWKMMMPSTDRSHELFWRQAARWLATTAPDPVGVAVQSGAAPGDTLNLEVTVGDRRFAPVSDAETNVRVTLPGGGVRAMKAALTDPAAGKYTAALAADQPGVYQVAADARRGAVSLGRSEQWVLVGGADQELVDPRLNEDVLRRIAQATGGRYVPEADARQVPALLRSAAVETGPPERRELWHSPWAFATILALLCSEWVLRRRWGLR